MPRERGKFTMPESLGGPKRDPDPLMAIAQLRDWKRNRERMGVDSNSTIDDAIEAIQWLMNKEKSDGE